MKRIALKASILLQSYGIYRSRTDTMATTTQPRPVKETSAQSLLLELDLGLRAWKLGFARDFSDRPWLREIAGGDGQALLKAIALAKRHFKRGAQRVHTKPPHIRRDPYLVAVPLTMS